MKKTMKSIQVFAKNQVITKASQKQLKGGGVIETIEDVEADID